MSTLAEAVAAAGNLDQGRFAPTEPVRGMPIHGVPTPEPIAVRRDVFLRCPLPPISSSPDSLRQFYRDGLPQMRVTPLTLLSK